MKFVCEICRELVDDKVATIQFQGKVTRAYCPRCSKREFGGKK